MKKIETLAEYQQLASRTCPDLGSFEDNFFHMQSGIITELGEAIDTIKKWHAYKKPLDIVNIGEEIADACWYIANKALLSKNENIALAWSTNENFVKGQFRFKTRFSEIPKGDYKKAALLLSSLMPVAEVESIEMSPLEIDMSCAGIDSIIILSQVAEIFDLDFFQILTNNITKLQVRYPEFFSNEKALNRDLDAERVELEKGEFLGTSEAEVTL